MGLPFTQSEFLDLFGAYNAALWPAIAVLWLLTAGATILWASGRMNSRWLSALAVLHWAWSGVAYHAVFFTRINPAAGVFAAGFMVQTFAFLWFGLAKRRLIFDWGKTPRHVLAALFLVGSLVYPVLVLFSGHEFPRAPIFAVPCPTTLFTAGLLLAAVPPVPRPIFIVPIAWSVIGGSAALIFGMTPDLMLFVAGACLSAYAAVPTVFGGVRAHSYPASSTGPIETKPR